MMNRKVEIEDCRRTYTLGVILRVRRATELYESELQSRALCGRRSGRASGSEDPVGACRIPGPDGIGRTFGVGDLLLGAGRGGGARLLHAWDARRRGGGQDAAGQAGGSHSAVVCLYGAVRRGHLY